jgi:hypothetical protein
LTRRLGLRDHVPVGSEAVRRTIVMRGFPKPRPPPHAASAVIHAVGTDVDYPEHAAPLSVKSVFRGVEVHEVGGVRYALDERAYLVLNDGRRYASHIRSRSPVEVLTVFFEPGLAREACESLRLPAAVLLDQAEGHGTGPVRLVERLYPRDDAVTPVLRAIRLAVREGTAPLVWLEEQLHVRLDRLLEVQRGFDPEVARLPDRPPVPPRGGGRRSLQKGNRRKNGLVPGP